MKSTSCTGNLTPPEIIRVTQAFPIEQKGNSLSDSGFRTLKGLLTVRGSPIQDWSRDLDLWIWIRSTCSAPQGRPGGIVQHMWWVQAMQTDFTLSTAPWLWTHQTLQSLPGFPDTGVLVGPAFQLLVIFASITDRGWKAASPMHSIKLTSILGLSTGAPTHWCGVNHTARVHPNIALALVRLASNKLLYTLGIFSSPGFPNEHCETYINKEMKHGSLRLRRKYHNHTNNINSLEKTLGAVNTLRWVVKGLGHIPVWSNRQLVGVLAKLEGRLHFSEAVQKWYWTCGNNNMEKPKPG